MTKNDHLVEQLKSELANHITDLNLAYGELTIECEAQNLKSIMLELRDQEAFSFDQLIDLCGVDATLRINGNVVDPVKFTCISAASSK